MNQKISSKSNAYTIEVPIGTEIEVIIMEAYYKFLNEFGDEPEVLFIGGNEYLELCAACGRHDYTKIPKKGYDKDSNRDEEIMVAMGYVSEFHGMKVFVKQSSGFEFGMSNGQRWGTRFWRNK